HEMADEVDVAGFGRWGREYVSGHEAHTRERSALAAFGRGDGFRHIEQRRAQLWIGGEHGRQQRAVAAADIDAAGEWGEGVGGDDRRRLRSVHLEHHAIEAAGPPPAVWCP